MGGMLRFPRRFLHDRTNAEVSQQKTIEVLLDERRSLTAQQHARPLEVGLQLTEGSLDAPSFRVQVCQFRGLKLFSDRAAW